MAVLQMQKLCICALKKDRKSLMEFLQAAGVLELSAEAEPDEVFKRTDTLEDRQKFERNAATADRCLLGLPESRLQRQARTGRRRRTQRRF